MQKRSRPWLPATLAAILAAGLGLLLLAPRAEAAAAPTVVAVSPALGPSVGGTSITITGTGFVSGATVSLGGVPATGVVVASATSITATSPAGTPGSAVVTITNPDTQSSTLSGAFTFQYPAPTVSAIAPASGNSAGGTLVTITGTNLRAGVTVNVGGSAATNIVLVDANSLFAVVPPHPIGVSAITVTNTDAQSGSLGGAFTYTAATAPAVTSVTPSAGTVAGGTTITIVGTGFVAGSTVTFGGIPSSIVTVNSATFITAVTPPQSVAGPVSITVTSPDSQSGTMGAAYTYSLRPAPTLSTVAPPNGPAKGGTAITLTGSNFLVGATVTVGSARATNVVVASSASITAIAPPGVAGTVPITVTNPDAQAGSIANGFTYTPNPAPTIGTITPADGPIAGGTSLTITGSGFVNGAMVLLDGLVLSGASVVSSTSITAFTPPHIAGAAPLRVMNPDGQSATSTSGFTYKAPPVPTLTGVDPSSGPIAGGGTVTLTGTNFVSGATVMFGAFTATNPVVTNATTITVTAPVGLSGSNAVTVRNPDGQVASMNAAYSYLGAGASVTAVTPDGGALTGGTVVTITGEGFVKGATVTFGSTAATKVVFVSDTEMTATAPVGVEGAADVTVTNPSTTPAKLEGAFNYQPAGPANVAVASTAPGGLSLVVAGTTDLQVLVKAQKFPVAAVYLLDVAKQSWKTYIVGAPASVNTLTSLKATDILVLRR